MISSLQGALIMGGICMVCGVLGLILEHFEGGRAGRPLGYSMIIGGIILISGEYFGVWHYLFSWTMAI
ncbi:TPA: hypothetical protein DIV45_02595 [Patescibacteria group bacterium]|uniref:Uncharacterized protein n=2 Tax=Bacteria division Kazan-3B-28 TaxID=1798534 RepID=A0A0G1KTA8_UNCK3|nr:MAG: hypothetical protein VE96_C0007G0006 [candidate division Kazan bacterium GW2011_GWA1_44_22]KKT86755.1 MAG: hypothetical protein VE97_C0019G0008 [candidate division Kazan bacterium GW2011_GWB1_45_10]HCR42224.1 hypothetical protein [Patescibacteria group bacterium]